MPVTGLRGRQIKDGDVFRADLNVTSSTQAVVARIVAGTGVTISSTNTNMTGTGDVTINASGVTSVGLALPNIFSITGSPVTTSGTLTGAFVNQNANLVFASPNGSAGVPTFRALVAADIPALTLENLPDAWVKRAVRVATTANITLSGTQTIDGIAIVAGDRVLVKNQTAQAENGIYVASATAWSRSADANTSSEIAGGMVAVDLGTANGGTTWDTDFRSSDTIGTTAMTWFRVIDTGYGAALTKTDDTNVTLTLGGSPTTALIQATSLTLGWTGQLAVGRGGTGASTLTGVLIGNGTSAFTAVAGTASQLLRRNSGNSAYEFFSAGNLTRTDDTNVTLTLGGTPTGSLINAVSLTLGWSGQLAVSRGGTGASSLTGVLIGNGTSAVTAVAGTASQLLRRNAGNTAYEFFTHDFASTSGATFTGQIVSTRANNTADGAGQIFLNGTGGNRIDWVAAGVAAPSYTTRSVGTKLVLYPSVNASQVDYGFGIESDTLWASVAVTGGSFKWYGGTQLNMHLSGQNLLVGSGVGVGAGRLTVVGAVGGTSLYLTDATNATLYITHTTGGRTNFFNGTATQWLMEVGGNVTIGNNTDAASKLTIYGGSLSTGGYGIQMSSQLTTGRLSTYDTSTANVIHTYFDNQTYEIAAGSTNGWVSGISITGRNATLHAGTIKMYTYSASRLEISGTGQIKFNGYTTTSSFSGTAVGVLAFDASGNILTIPTPGGGSGITGSGTQNYIPKFGASGTSIGNSTIFDNGSDIGIGTATPTNLANYRTIDILGGASGALVRFMDSTATFRGAVYGSTAETAINAVAQFNLYVNSTQLFNAQPSQVNAYETFYARKLGAQIQLAGGVATASGIFQGGNNLLFISDWATGANGIVIDVSNGITRVRGNAANGSYLQFQRSTSTDYGYIGNAAQLCFSPFNAVTDLAIRSEGAILFATSGNARAAILGTGQLRLINYTATSSFTGTAVGVLAFDASGNILTIATPGGGGSSQWTTSGSNIYYNTGNVGIGATTPLQALHIVEPNGTDSMIRFDQTSQRTYDIGILASTQAFTIRDVSATANRLQVLGTGQLVLNAYTSLTSFSYSNYQGQLGFDGSGNIIPVSAAFYNINFLAAGNLILNNMATALQFFNNQTSYIARADLIGYKRVRLHVLKGGTAGAAASKIILRYRTVASGFSITTTDYTNIGTSEVSVALNTTNAYLSTGWITLATAAQGDVYIALMMSGGDGAADPIVGNIYAEFDYRS